MAKEKNTEPVDTDLAKHIEEQSPSWVSMTKDGETIDVHHTTVEAHRLAGWKTV